MIRENLIGFFNNWLQEKEKAAKILEENRRYNAALKDDLVPGKSYPKDRRSYSLYNLKSAGILSNDLPSLLHKDAGILKTRYKIQGSIGQGNPSEIPWICIFDLEISKSAQEGFYIVYLFKSDMSGVYLSLNQGWTQYEKEFGVKLGRTEIKKNSEYSRSLLKSYQGFSPNPIELKATKSLGKGYELGNICSVYYPGNDIPSDLEIVDDLRNLLGVYRELKGFVGEDILGIKGKLCEEIYQNEIQRGKRKELGPGAILKKDKKQKVSSTSWSRDANISYTALSNAGFKCEYNPNHKTFKSASTGFQFVEAHHLIPMEFQDDFDVSIDVPENIISLCPTCHRAFHNSVPEYKKQLISNFYNKRKEALKSRGINIQVSKLYQYYRIPTNIDPVNKNPLSLF